MSTTAAAAAAPIPPENVRAVYAGDREVPVELVHIGHRDGFALWEAVVPLPRPLGLRADVIPARTILTVRLRDHDDAHPSRNRNVR